MICAFLWSQFSKYKALRDGANTHIKRQAKETALKLVEWWNGWVVDKKSCKKHSIQILRASNLHKEQSR